MNWIDVQSLAVFASGMALIVMGLAYAVGHFFQDPRFNVWVKTEIFQVAVSIVLVFSVLFLIGLVGIDKDAQFSATAGWITTFSEDAAEYEHPEIEEGFSVYEVSDAYLTNLAFFTHRAVRGSRAMMGAMDEYSKYGRSPCVPPWLMCLLGANGVNARPLGGAIALMQASNLFLYTSTSAHLTNLAQLLLLRFLESGFVGIYLPLAIILRSLPFMRPFGGALIAICIALVVLYPMLLYVESSFWNPFDWTADDGSWDDVEDFVKDVEGKDGALAYGTLFLAGDGWYFSDALYDALNSLIRVCSAAFLSSTFLFLFNILAVSSAAMMFARLLGTEVDLSSLMQIV